MVFRGDIDREDLLAFLLGRFFRCEKGEIVPF